MAELGATLLCADLDLTLEPREDHAAYIATWLDALKAANRAIFTGASHAQRAAEFIHGLQPAPAASFVIATLGCQKAANTPALKENEKRMYRF